MKTQTEIENVLNLLIKNLGTITCVKYDIQITLIDVLSWILEQSDTFQDVIDEIFEEADRNVVADNLRD